VFGAGLLAGKYKGMTEPNQGSRMQMRMQMDGARFWHPRGFRAAQAIEGVSEEDGRSPWRSSPSAGRSAEDS